MSGWKWAKQKLVLGMTVAEGVDHCCEEHSKMHEL